MTLVPKTEQMSVFWVGPARQISRQTVDAKGACTLVTLVTLRKRPSMRAGSFRRRFFLNSEHVLMKPELRAEAAACQRVRPSISLHHFIDIYSGSVLDVNNLLHGLISGEGERHFVISNLEQKVSGSWALQRTPVD